MKVYEITNKNYMKHYVKGVKNDKEAKMLGKKVFGKSFFDVSYYSSNHKTLPSMTKTQFKRLSWRYKKL